MKTGMQLRFLSCFSPGDFRVRTLLQKQKAFHEGVLVCPSQFVYYLYMEGRYILFHTLTRQLLLVEPEVIGWFAGKQTFPAEMLQREDAAFLWENWFLVPADRKESETWQQVRQLLMLKEEVPEGISHFVILPTTACNARCIYCFEQGIKPCTMDRDTAEDTIRFILKYRPTGGKIHIHWFGGEPACVPGIINRICEGLLDAGVEFNAEMTSNGSLFTPELAKHAKKIWKMERIQITLDGLANEYAARKRYWTDIQNPFDTVIRNIRILLSEGIHVAIRLNVDEKNVDEIFRTIKFLKEFYTEEERRGMTVYAHSLFRTFDEGFIECASGAGSDELEEAVLKINETLIRQGLQKKNLGELFWLKTRCCMAAAPEYNMLIDAEGRLFACNAMPQTMLCGDIKNGIVPAFRENSSKSHAPDAHCEQCVFLPQCTDFSMCPNRLPFDACLRQEKRKLNRDLRMMYYWFQNNQTKEMPER